MKAKWLDKDRPISKIPWNRTWPPIRSPCSGEGTGWTPSGSLRSPHLHTSRWDTSSLTEKPWWPGEVVSVSLVQEESLGPSSPPWGSQAGRDLFSSPKVPIGVHTGARVLGTRWLFCSNKGWPASAPGWTLAWYLLPQALWSLLNLHRTEVSHFEILTPKASCWTGITLPLPTGAARSACAVVGHSTVWEPWVTHESPVHHRN